MNQDFAEFFALLNAKKVEYLVIGGVAYNFHAPPRATKDIDVWARPERGNLERLLLAIAEFGFPTHDLELNELEAQPRVLMLGRPPNRIDVLTRPSGLDWATTWPNRIETSYSGVPVFVLSIGDLITAKRAAARPQDLADAAKLEDIVRRRRS